MSITSRHYNPEPFFSQDYLKVRKFLQRINHDQLTTPNFTWSRWEWMICHAALDATSLTKIGLWEENGNLVAIATYESSLGEAFFLIDPPYRFLLNEMIDYAKINLKSDNGISLIIADGDRDFQRLAASKGFLPTTKGEHIAAIDITTSLHYELPEGFRIISQAESWDWFQYNRVMWRGFNHEGVAPDNEKDISTRKQMLSSPMINPELVLAVVAPNGNYVSHCGMWYCTGESYAHVEPVATDPDFRKMGLGKAIVLEAVMRCGNLGAKQALVGSAQQFYYSIGFHPIHRESWWKLQ